MMTWLYGVSKVQEDADDLRKEHRIQMMKIVLLVVMIGLSIIQNKKLKNLQSKTMQQNS